MDRTERQHLVCSFHQLTNAAERFVNRAPQSKRLEEDRQKQLDAITSAQLILSICDSPREAISTPVPAKKGQTRRHPKWSANIESGRK